MFDPCSVRFVGPLVPHTGDFLAELLRRGYTALSAGAQLRLAAHLSRWLASRSLRLGDLTAEQVDAFLAERRSLGYSRFLSPRALAPLLEHLHALGLAPTPVRIEVDTPTERLLRDYAAYLTSERALSAGTIRRRLDSARKFLAARPECDLLSLSAADVIEFCTRASGHCNGSELRCFLRFAHLRGLVLSDLVGAVPAVAGWRLAGLPKAIGQLQVERLGRVSGSAPSVARRNAAILTLLVRLGLRAGEVSSLRLEDIDWRAGEITVRGKGRRQDRLPLPADVGRVLAAYLRHPRPQVSSRQVFLRSRAPYAALTTAGIVNVAVAALRSIGVRSGGAHLLRHTAATQMLRHGASLSEVGHVLRHRHIDTTAIYAKLDDLALRRLVRPWPGGIA